MIKMPTTRDSAPVSPLESFLRDYVSGIGGVWDEIEPQVYDVLLPEAALEAVERRADPSLVRLTFDPEALPEHPEAQLASLGTPVVDSILRNAVERGSFVDLYALGLNLEPYGVENKILRALTFAEGLALEVERCRVLDFPQCVFWFELTFTGDQREQELLPAGVDLHYNRPVRHLETLLDTARLGETPSLTLPEAPHASRFTAYRSARREALRTLTALANVRARELADRVKKQVRRMSRYYEDLGAEIDEQARRAAARGDTDDEKFRSRRALLAREREVRIAELHKKSALQVKLRLLSVVVVHQPKLLYRTSVVNRRPRSSRAQAPAVPLAIVWDPLLETVEAAACPTCGGPTFELIRAQTSVACPACAPPNCRGPR